MRRESAERRAGVLYAARTQIIPPKRIYPSYEGVAPCLCCGRPSKLDEDCCGICEECLSP
ncbi:hypothetical protein E0H33_15200 [Rhizobium leguminosarum bv. viciae]|nr:hypothetical protein E0H32_19670 [Rhizobium leguminosarum bv. viciae]TBZ14810.1 hypothetical protein E0H33_15200 [Rhizobium leguminosarum bv. viciae]